MTTKQKNIEYSLASVAFTLLVIFLLQLAPGKAHGDPGAGTNSNELLALGGTSRAICAPAGTTVIFDGDSITQSPNGAGLISWAGLLASGTYPANSWFATARNIITGQGGSVVYNGTNTTVAGKPQTVVVKWAGSSATTLTILSGSAYSLAINNGSPAPMGVFGSQIQFGTTGTITSSGTALYLSASTTGTSGTGVTLRLGGNNSMDRFASQVAAHAPAAHGGDSGNGPVYYVIQGFANDLAGGESASTIETALLALSATAQAYGMIPVVGTCLPCAYLNNVPMWWGTSGEPIREAVNEWILQGNVPGAYVVDSTRGMSGQPENVGSNTAWPGLDVNGIHPIGVSNSNIAVAWNNSAVSGWGNYKAQPQYVDTATEFQQSITLDNGITITGSTGGLIDLTQGALSPGNTLELLIGTTNGTGYNQAGFGFVYSGSNSESGNLAVMGIGNCYPLAVNAGGNSSTGEVSIGYSVSGAQSMMTGSQKVAIQLQPYTEDGIDITTSGNYPYFFFDWRGQPNINVGSQINGYCVGTAKSTGNAGLFDWLNNGSDNAHNGWVLTTYAGPNNMIGFISGDVLIGTGTTDNGYLFEVGGGAKIDSNVTVAGTNTVTGLQVSSTGTVLKNLMALTGTAALPQMNPGTSGTMTIGNSAFAAGGEVWWLASAPLPVNAVLTSGTISSSGTAQIVFNNPSLSATVSAATVPYQMLYLH